MKHIFVENPILEDKKAIMCWDQEGKGLLLYILYTQTENKIRIVKIDPPSPANNMSMRAFLHCFSELKKKALIVVFPNSLYSALYTGCKYIEELDEWVWRHKDCQEGPVFDGQLAEHMGWKCFVKKEGGSFAALPPGIECKESELDKYVKDIPHWSTDKAAALGMLLSLRDEFNYDYQLSDVGGMYTVTLCYDEEIFKSQNSSMPLAISKAIMEVYEYREELEKSKKKIEETKESSEEKEQKNEYLYPANDMMDEPPLHSNEKF